MHHCWDEPVSLQLVITTIVTVSVLLLVIIAKRLSKVVRTWVRIEKDQIKTLKEANKRYRMTHPPTRPSGRALYKRNMLTHDGLAIYPNGILAKFCVGREGKYRFVPFHEISDIYPAFVDFFVFGSELLSEGPTAMNAIQIETESSMVYLIEPRHHKLEKVLPALKQAMGAWWGSKFHDDELIRGSIAGGDAYIHKSLRRMIRKTTPATRYERVSREPAPRPTTGGKGALLLEESPEDVRTRAKMFVQGGVGFFVLGVILTLIGFALLTIGSPTGIMWMIIMLFIALGPFSMFAGGLLLAFSSKLKPMKMYENGIEGYPPLGTSSFFISYGAVTEITEVKNPIIGDVYLFKTANPMQSISLRKNTPGLERILDSIREKIGRPEYLMRLEPTERKEVTSRKVEHGIYAGSLVAGFVISLIASIILFQGENLDVFFSGFGLIMPSMTMIIIVYATYSMSETPSFSKFVPKKLNLKVPAIIIVIMLVLFFLSGAVGSNLFGPSPETKHISPKPASSAVTPGLHENTTIDAHGDILVDSGETTTFRNSTITFHATIPGSLGVWVAEGGTLILDNSLVTTWDPVYTYTFEIMGSATIRGSALYNLWGEWDDYDGGLEIYSDNVTIEGTEIGYSKQSSIIVVDSSPLIANSTIIGAGDDGIELQNSDARIINNTISSCEWGMYVYSESRAVIEDNRITHNHFGILIEESDPMILNNEFLSNTHYAILYRKDSSPTIVNNRFYANGANIETESELSTTNICTMFTVAMAVVGLLVLFHLHRKSKNEKDQQYGVRTVDKTLWRPPKGPYR